MKEKEDSAQTVAKVTSIAAIGAGAGVGVAAIFSAPLLIPALVGGSIACAAAAIIKVIKKD